MVKVVFALLPRQVRPHSRASSPSASPWHPTTLVPTGTLRPLAHPFVAIYTMRVYRQDLTLSLVYCSRYLFTQGVFAAAD